MLSRRVLLEKERAALKESTLERLKEGQLVEGIVKNLTEYGAFIDLGGLDGLLHIGLGGGVAERQPEGVLGAGRSANSRTAAPWPSACATRR